MFDRLKMGAEAFLPFLEHLFLHGQVSEVNCPIGNHIIQLFLFFIHDLLSDHIFKLFTFVCDFLRAPQLAINADQVVLGKCTNSVNFGLI